MTAGRDLRERREALVREHMESENHLVQPAPSLGAMEADDR